MTAGALFSGLRGYRRSYLALCSVFAAVAAGAVVALIWPQAVSRWLGIGGDKLLGAILDAGAKVCLAVSVLVTIYVAFRRILASDDSLLDSRFALAIRLLGSVESRRPGRAGVVERLGAVMLLESVVDKDPAEFAVRILSLLTQYIRSQPDPGSADLSNRADLDAAFRLVFRLTRQIAPERRIDLAGLRLKGLRLGDEWDATDRAWPAVDLTGADLQGAFLAHMDLRNVVLVGVHFDQASLEGTKWRGLIQECTFNGAELRTAELSDATFRVVEMRETTLVGSRLQRVRFEGNANLQEAEFVEAHLTHVAFGNANIASTFWQRARLDDVDLSNASADAKAVESLREASATEGLRWPSVEDAEETASRADSMGAPSL
jgi:uncharacterized protein YjbI with pentapeptide repeats